MLVQVSWVMRSRSSARKGEFYAEAAQDVIEHRQRPGAVVIGVGRALKGGFSGPLRSLGLARQRLVS